MMKTFYIILLSSCISLMTHAQSSVSISTSDVSHICCFSEEYSHQIFSFLLNISNPSQFSLLTVIAESKTGTLLYKEELRVIEDGNHFYLRHKGPKFLLKQTANAVELFLPNKLSTEIDHLKIQGTDKAGLKTNVQIEPFDFEINNY